MRKCKPRFLHTSLTTTFRFNPAFRDEWVWIGKVSIIVHHCPMWNTDSGLDCIRIQSKRTLLTGQYITRNKMTADGHPFWWSFAGLISRNNWTHSKSYSITIVMIYWIPSWRAASRNWICAVEWAVISSSLLNFWRISRESRFQTFGRDIIKYNANVRDTPTVSPPAIL